MPSYLITLVHVFLYVTELNKGWTDFNYVLNKYILVYNSG